MMPSSHVMSLQKDIEVLFLKYGAYIIMNGIVYIQDVIHNNNNIIVESRRYKNCFEMTNLISLS